MKPSPYLRFNCLMVLVGLLLSVLAIRGQDASLSANAPKKKPTTIYPIDLTTVLRLANAQNLDVLIARERLAEAKAIYDGSVIQFLPWLSPGISFRRHENLLQNVQGDIIDVNKQSYAPGLAINAQVDVGDALYKSLSARQGVLAADHGVEAQRQTSVLSAVQSYYDLLKAQAQVGVQSEAQGIAQNLERQLVNAVEAGLAYKGDELRAKVQSGQTELALRRALEEQRVASARLAEVLHLDSSIELVAKDLELVPISLMSTNAALGSLVEQALAKRPELHQTQALISAAESTQQGAVYGPLIPTLGGQAFVGGLGGGRDHAPSRFGQSEDYAAFLSWRIGPGGLFDLGRIRLSKSRLGEVKLSEAKLWDAITREVVESVTRFRSLASQLNTAKRTLEMAAEAEKLAEQRKEFAIGAVLEDIQTQQDLTRARNDFVQIVAEFNKSQYALQRAIGGIMSKSQLSGVGESATSANNLEKH